MTFLMINYFVGLMFHDVVNEFCIDNINNVDFFYLDGASVNHL